MGLGLSGLGEEARMTLKQALLLWGTCGDINYLSGEEKYTEYHDVVLSSVLFSSLDKADVAICFIPEVLI